MNKVAVFATLRAQPGKLDELVTALGEMVEGVGAEEGTEVYVLHTVESEPDTVRFYELYTHADALKAHGGSDLMKSMGARLAGLVAGAPEIVPATPVRAKGLALDT